MMRSSDKPQNGNSNHEAAPRISKQKRSIENSTSQNEIDPGRQAGVARPGSIVGDIYYRTIREYCPEERRRSRVVGGIVGELIEGSLDQLQDTRDSIKRLQHQEKRLQERILRLEELKKLADD